MSLNIDEKKIINIIRYTPIIFIFILSLLTTQIVLHKKNENFNKESKIISNAYLTSNKERVKEEIERVYSLLKTEKDEAEELLKKKIKQRVYEAHKIATNLYLEESKQKTDGKASSKEDIFQTIKNVLSSMTYDNGRGYVFLIDDNGKLLLQPNNKVLEGRNISAFNNKELDIFVNKTIETLKNKSEGYSTYPWFKLYDLDKKYTKISFFKYFEPLDIMIGSGEYIEDFENELKEELLQRIRNIRFAETGYVFIYNLDGTCLSHFKKEFIGVNRLGVKDKNGKLVVKDVLDYAKKNKQGFMSYIATMKPNDKVKSREKVSYVKLFDDWNWVLGTGFYLDSLNNQIAKGKEELIKSNDESIEEIVYFATIITFLTLLISFYISKYLEKRFLEYKLKLETKNETLLKAQEVAHIGDWKLDLKTNKAYWSEEIIRIFGVDKKDKDKFGPEYFKNIIINEDISCFEESINKCIFNNEEHKCFYRIKRPNGELRWIDCRGRLDSKKEIIIGTVQDITESKEQQDKLLEQKKELEIEHNKLEIISSRLSLALDSARIGVWDVNIETDETTCDDRMYEIYGLDKMSSMTYDIWYNSVLPEDRAMVVDIMEQVVLTKTRASTEFRILRSDGEIRYIISSNDVLCDATGKVTNLIGTDIDITEQKQKDELLYHQSKMAAMGEMIGNIAHQWRQPLSLISMSASGIKVEKEIGILTDEELESSLTRINESVQHLSQTIDDFRNFLNPSNSKVKKFYISDTISKALKLIKAQFAHNDIEIIENIENFELLSIENELIQVIINILNNSKDALEKLENQKRFIFIKTYKKGNSIFIEIKDNANGIPENIINRVFEPYFTTKHQSQGTGIGLYMSQEIVKNHLEGTLSVSNEKYTYEDIDYIGAKFTIMTVI